MFKIGDMDEVTFYVFGPDDNDPLPFFAIVTELVGGLADRGMKTGLLSTRDHFSVVVVAGPKGTMNVFRKALNGRDDLWKAVGKPIEKIRPWANVTNVADEGHYLASMSPYLNWFSKYSSGALEWVEVPQSALKACFAPAETAQAESTAAAPPVEPAKRPVEKTKPWWKFWGSRAVSPNRVGGNSPVRTENEPPQTSNTSPRASVASSSVAAEMVRIEAGTFLMGSPVDEAGRADDEKQHLVSITKSFLLGAKEVTQQQWEEVMGKNRNLSYFQNHSVDLPVNRVTWLEAVEFCNSLSDLEGLPRCYLVEETSVRWDRSSNGYRLPTEAEWEYAARAGTITAFNTGQCLSTDEANYDGNSPQVGCPSGQFRRRPVRVGSFPPNPWGLYDIHGNVWEWVWDRMAEYPTSGAADPTGPENGSGRVSRGGGWHNGAQSCRSAKRLGAIPDYRGDAQGFRLARSLP